MANADPTSFSKLKFVSTRDTVSSSVNLPDLLILGPQRTGTNWLHRNLNLHPSVFMSKTKEIHYFNNIDNPDARLFQSKELAWYASHFQPSLKDRFRNQMRNLYRFGSLFPMTCFGEASATYAAGVKEEVIDDIVLLNPDIKCVLMVRNPINRAWSHAKKDLLNISHINLKERSAEDVGDDEFFEFFTQSYQLGCSRYTEQISRWEAKLKTGNLFVGLFDDIQSRPAELLLQLFEFLQVESSKKFLTKRMEEKISVTDGKSKPRVMNSRIESFLEKLFAEELDRLQDRFQRRLIA